MSTITFENAHTGKTREVESGRGLPYPWRVKTDAVQARQRAQVVKYWSAYKYRKCSNCGEMGVYEYP